MECTRVLPKSRVANPARLAPAKSDLAAKTNPEGGWPVPLRLEVWVRVVVVRLASQVVVLPPDHDAYCMRAATGCY